MCCYSIYICDCVLGSSGGMPGSGALWAVGGFASQAACGGIGRVLEREHPLHIRCRWPPGARAGRPDVDIDGGCGASSARVHERLRPWSPDYCGKSGWNSPTSAHDVGRVRRLFPWQSWGWMGRILCGA
jgi:hypothetical protein